MWEPIRSSFEASARRIASAIAAFLPGLVALVAIVVISLVVAAAVRGAVRRVLVGVGFDRWAHRWGLAPAGDWAASTRPSAFVAGVAFWLLLLAGFLLGLNVFDASAASALAYRAIAYLPEVVAAAVILVVGLVASRFLERNVLISAVNMQIQSARLLSLGVKWLVWVLAVAMALQHLGIGGPLVTISFSILFGGIVLALALAIGLGSRDVVSKTLEKQIRKEKEQRAEVEDEVHHL